MDAVLRVNIIDGPFVGVVYTLALGAVLFIAVRRPTRRWIITGSSALLAGSVTAFVALWLVKLTNTFGVELSVTTSIWVYLTFAAIWLAIVNLWKSRWPRKVVALPPPPPTPSPSRTPFAGGALWANWIPSKDQPAAGTIGSVTIPNSLPGFRSRPAGLYLPPAAAAPRHHAHGATRQPGPVLPETDP
jgi:hypothetical protein